MKGVAAKVLQDLLERGIRIRVKDGKLVALGSPEAVDGEVRRIIREHRAELLEFLTLGDDAQPGQAGDGAEHGELTPTLSSFQHRLWLLYELGLPMAAYNISSAYRLKGPLDPERLRASVENVVAGQDALRTQIAGDLDAPFPQVLDDMPLPWTVVSDPALRDEETLEEWLRDFAEFEFDLREGPLFRLALVTLTPDEHILAGVFHHSIFDGESTGLFWDLVSSGYQGEPIPGASRPSWQYGALQSLAKERDRDATVAFWKDVLSGPLPVLDLPLDFPRPPEQDYSGDSVSWEVPHPVRADLHRVAKDCGCSEFVLLLAAYQLTLARYSRQDDHVFGVPTSDRDEGGFQGSLGCMVNVLPIRSFVDPKRTLVETTKAITRRFYEAMSHRSLPLEEIVAELDVPWDPSRTPVYQTLFAYQERNPGPDALGELAVSPVEMHHRSSQTDLACWIVAGTSLAISLNYATTLFTRATVQQILADFARILESVAALESPSVPIGSLSSLAGTQTRLLEDWNATEIRLPENSVFERFREMARRKPEADAFIGPGATLSYEDVESDSNRLAGLILGATQGKPGLVGVSLNRTERLPVALLAVMKSGAGIVPLDPAFPPARLAYILEDSGADLLLTESSLEHLFEEYTGPRMDLDEIWPTLGDIAADDPGLPPGDVFQVIYTSGSTGRPKGVVVGQNQTTNFLESMAREPGVHEDDRVLAVTTISFDISVLELWLGSRVGAACVIVEQEVAADGMLLRQAIEAERPTVVQATPATYRGLVEAGWVGSDSTRVLCGGEALPDDLATELLERSGELWNMYGPTETTVWSTCELVTSVPVTIGRPIANTQIHILDEGLSPVPIGAPGEICIGGLGVNPGYWNREELTADRFVPDPFSPEPSGMLYRTGDLGRWRADGRIEYFSRLDHQVKVRGFRIELGEIEASLLAHPAIREVVVHPQGEGTDVRLVAYAVFKGQESLTATDIRGFLVDRLPQYMLPSLLVELDELPLTPNGKIDRKALQDPVVGGYRAQTEFSAPETAEEVLIAEVWADLLGVDRVGRTDNFYDLGGHSLLSMRAVSQIEKRSGIRLNPQFLFFRTLAQLAEGLLPDQ